MATAGDQINGALRLLGVLAEGETPSAETSQDALNALNQMIDSWNTERLSVFSTQDQVFNWPVGEISRMQIETTDLSERDVPAVQIGQSVNVYIEALDATVTGKVIRISPISETVGGDVVYPVTIELDEQIPGLLWGMSAEVEIAVK